MRYAGLRFGHATGLARYDCPKCGEKEQLHKHNRCVNCKHMRSVGGETVANFTPRQIAHIRRLA
jgi:predicted RNA-binding Zn-ribbon protein involved in translation (DUF1610 family)